VGKSDMNSVFKKGFTKAVEKAPLFALGVISAVNKIEIEVPEYEFEEE
jgi:hypothetical protein